MTLGMNVHFPRTVTPKVRPNSSCTVAHTVTRHASRVVISLHYLEEMTLAEIAAIEGIPEGTVKSRLAYGLTALRTFGRTP